MTRTSDFNFEEFKQSFARLNKFPDYIIGEKRHDNAINLNGNTESYDESQRTQETQNFRDCEDSQNFEPPAFEVNNAPDFGVSDPEENYDNPENFNSPIPERHDNEPMTPELNIAPPSQITQTPGNFQSSFPQCL